LSNSARIAIVVVVAVAVSAVIAAKTGPRPATAVSPEVVSGLPTLVELGSTTCVPCQMMEEVLDELRDGYQERLNVQFVNVHADPDTAQAYGVRVIPTQVFLDAQGNEVFRHEGYFPTEDILKAFSDHGVVLQ